MNVVSLALFGDGDRYRRYLPTAIRAHHALYAGWTLRIHHDRTLDSNYYGKALRALASRGLVELVLVDGPVLKFKAMLWRLLPLWDKKVERFICRDVDTVPVVRERLAVEEWIKSDLAFHAISDRAVDHNWPTLGGMIGFLVKPSLSLLKNPTSFDDLLVNTVCWPDEIWSGKKRVSGCTENDQFFLGEHLWPVLKNNALEHRLSGSHRFEARQTLTSVVAVADAFVPFIGSADVDLPRALSFYKMHGNREKEISECERVT